MPVYLCKPGFDTAEPWRHGVQVYAYPFSIGEDDQHQQQQPSRRPRRIDEVHHDDETIHHSNGIRDDANHRGLPIRRVRHAEVVLVDEVSVQYGRYWLKLRWPGPQGGFAGYIALGNVVDFGRGVEEGGEEGGEVARMAMERARRWQVDKMRMSSQLSDEVIGSIDPFSTQHDIPSRDSSVSPGRQSPADLSTDDIPSSPQEEQEKDRLPPVLPPRCSSTGLYFPSSSTMELLHMYDDGLSSLSGDGSVGHGLMISLGHHDDASGEPVFCRICREGLHDVNYDLGTATSSNPSPLSSSLSPSTLRQPTPQPRPRTSTEENHSRSPSPPSPSHPLNSLLHQAATHHPTAENPLLAPCECSGSIAFVHYLCVEQWRCRSRHPAARSGLNCETCGSPYTLPPPPSRPVTETVAAGVFAEDDWLEAMPAHVLAALRRPHPWWQIGAAVVRRKWLRPIAPVIISPIVALYCRARRMLKKRGVSRRRWACSLCRRRARWKCVRCLRSYYCSRQCQNVSWHIVHKHVCYKPARFGWSVVVYGGGGMIAFPGIWKEPLIYITGFLLIPTNFFIIGILAGAIASITKKFIKIDMRGRCLEVSVVLATIAMTLLSFGIVRGFFGNPSRCVGVLPKNIFPSIPHIMTKVMFTPIGSVLTVLDGITRSIAPIVCTQKTGKCFQTIADCNPNFLLEDDAKHCAKDAMILTPMWMIAAMVLLYCSMFKKRDRERRGRAERAGGRGRVMFVGERRPHQD